jgi:putative transposase
MPEYRRAYDPGGTFIFTVVTYDRSPILLAEDARQCLHDAIARTQQDHPFALDAIVLLPDHLHAIWTLPENDADFSMRWRLIKSRFTREWRRSEAEAGLSSRPTFSRASRGERDVWQQRFWEHAIRDDEDLERHLDYLHFNPVKHGLAKCPHAWPWSSFERQVRERLYASDWCCVCNDRIVVPPDDSWTEGMEIE